jgi:hypothetical protein
MCLNGRVLAKSSQEEEECQNVISYPFFGREEMACSIDAPY